MINYYWTRSVELHVSIVDSSSLEISVAKWWITDVMFYGTDWNVLTNVPLPSSERDTFKKVWFSEKFELYFYQYICIYMIFGWFYQYYF